MPKLFQINVTLNVGSTGRIVEQIGSLAVSQGWEVWIAHGPRFINKSEHNTYQICTLLEEKIHGVKSRLFDDYGLGCTSATKKLVKKIQEVKPDIIHLHNIHGYFLNYKVLFEYLRKIDIPVVWTLHDCWTFTGHCAHFEVHKCYRWKEGCKHCKWPKAYPQCYGISQSKRNFDLKESLFTSVRKLTLVPVSKWQENFLKESFFANKPNVAVKTIWNGVDINFFIPQNNARQSICDKYKIKSAYIVLGVANRWTKSKGFDDILDLRRKLSMNYTIVLLGVTEKQISLLPEGIVGITRTESQKEMGYIYSAADVYINPTYSDTFPTVNLEALACGIPVITYKTGGSPEAVGEGTGIVLDKGDVNGLNEYIIEICTKGKAAFNDICRKRAEHLYDQRNTFQAYMDLYYQMLNSK